VKAKKRSLPPTTLSVLVGLGGVLVLAAGLYLLVLPQRHKAAQLTREIASTQTQIATARLQAAPKPQQRIRVSDVFALSKAMPDRTDMTGVILQLQKTANESGVELDSIQPHASEPATGYTVQPIDLSVGGGFFRLTDFVSRLRRLVTVRHGTLHASGRLFSVTGIAFGAGAHGFPSLTASVSVDAYVYGGAAAVPAGLPPVAAGTTATTTTDSGTAAVASGTAP
jgi:Tfp pilus assembly protein PilO